MRSVIKLIMMNSVVPSTTTLAIYIIINVWIACSVCEASPYDSTSRLYINLSIGVSHFNMTIHNSIICQIKVIPSRDHLD